MESNLRPPKLNDSLLLTLAVFLAAIGAICFLLHLAVIPLNEDVVYVIQATWNLLHDGNLRNSGLCYAFQTLRPEFHTTQPFFGPYVVAVYYFWPFFKFFGANDYSFFLGQSVLLIFLGAFLAKSGLGWRWSVLTISLSVLAETLVGSIITSPTQLLAICFVAYFWFRVEHQDLPYAAIDGLLIGAGLFCRPEVIMMGLFSTAQIAWECHDPKKRHRFIAQTFVAALIFIGILKASLWMLGAANDYDSKLVLLMSGVLAPSFQILGLSHFPPLSTVLTNPILLSRLIHKVMTILAASVGPSSFLWRPTTCVLVFLPLVLMAARISNIRNYAFAYLLYVFQMGVNTLQIPMSRHYEAGFFFLFCAMARDVKRLSDPIEPKYRRQFNAGILLLTGLLLANQLRTLQDSLQNGLGRRKIMLEASEEAHRRVPADAFVITDMPGLWLWYGHGKMGCFVPLNNPETMGLVLAKFPEAFMVMFFGDQRAGYPLAPFKRPLLSATHHVAIYGPSIKEKHSPEA